MIRTLLATTALTALIATGAMAQTQPAPADPAAPTTEQPASVTQAEGYLVTNMIGETVYNGTADNAENIGEVNDLVLDMEGKVKAIVVGVGGFLGIGEKNVALEYDTIEWAEKDGERWIVVAATKDELNALPTFDTKPYIEATATAPGTTTTPAAPTTAEAPATADQPVAAAPADASTDKSTT